MPLTATNIDTASNETRFRVFAVGFIGFAAYVWFYGLLPGLIFCFEVLQRVIGLTRFEVAPIEEIDDTISKRSIFAGVQRDSWARSLRMTLKFDYGASPSSAQPIVIV